MSVFIDFGANGNQVSEKRKFDRNGKAIYPNILEPGVFHIIFEKNYDDPKESNFQGEKFGIKWRSDKEPIIFSISLLDLLSHVKSLCGLPPNTQVVYLRASKDMGKTYRILKVIVNNDNILVFKDNSNEPNISLENEYGGYVNVDWLP